MGLLDMITGLLSKKGKKGTKGGAAAGGLPDLGGVMGMLGGGGQAGLLKALLPALMGAGALGGKVGGLGGLLGKLTGGGLGAKADSWVGTGANEPVDPDELEAALGADTVDEVAKEAGVSRDEAKGGLAKLLPSLVDKVTPGGKVPDQGQLGSLLSKLDVKSLLG